MDTAQWTQPIKEMERRDREVRKEEALKKCPRCNSKNTKFCYYNNYSLSQPRYFCKTCRRYWTHGGSLRTIPVGGASRKNKTSTRSSSSSSSSKNNKPFVPPDLLLLPPPTHEEAKAQDLAFSQELQGISSNSSPSGPTFTALPNASSSSSGFGLSYEFIGPALGFSLDDPIPLTREEESSGGLLFQSLKTPSSSSITNSVVEYNHSQKNPDDLLHDKGEEEEEEADRSAAFWSDLFGGGGGDSWHL